MGRRNSQSLAALMKVLPGNGTRSASDAGRAFPCSAGCHGGGISQPINSAGGAGTPPHCRRANAASQYERLPSCTMAANNWMRAPLTGVAAVRGPLVVPTIRSASS